MSQEIDVSKALRNMPEEIRDRVQILSDKYKQTGNIEYVNLIFELLDEFDDEAKKLVRVRTR